MAAIRKRKRARGSVWIVDYRDAAGVRRWITCRTKEEAEDARADVVKESRQPVRPAVDRAITVAAYAERWLSVLGSGIKPRTLENYNYVLHRHVLPELGPFKIRHLQKGQLKAILAAKLTAGLSRATVKLILAVIRGLLNAAIDDGVILANPAQGLGRKLKLGKRQGERAPVRAMTPTQLGTLLAKARELTSRLHPLFLLLARSGLRLGEAFGLEWADLDLTAREARVERTSSRGRVGTPKSGVARTVDLSRDLAAMLRRLEIHRKAETLRAGWPAMPPRVFVTPAGAPLTEHSVRPAFHRVLKAAGLPRFRLHDLRHTFAVHLLQTGASPVYVKEQLGHHSISVTVDVYGRWLPTGDKSLVDRLDGLTAGVAVASGSQSGPELIDLIDTDPVARLTHR